MKTEEELKEKYLELVRMDGGVESVNYKNIIHGMCTSLQWAMGQDSTAMQKLIEELRNE